MYTDSKDKKTTEPETRKDLHRSRPGKQTKNTKERLTNRQMGICYTHKDRGQGGWGWGWRTHR